ncbi:hypothetical protein B0H21DRAFT_710584 [Amylocystis lapponica]|nr:hypothetical protein B0H21DRAFT_710584 [Amylocystis lapponica]
MPHEHTAPDNSRHTVPNVSSHQASVPERIQTVKQENVARSHTWNESQQFNTEQDFKPPTQDFWPDTILNYVWVESAGVGWLPGMEITHTRPGVDPNWPTREEFEECQALWREFRLAECMEDDSTDFKNGSRINPINLPSLVVYHDERRTAQRYLAHEPVYTVHREYDGSTSRPVTSFENDEIYHTTPRR